MSLRFTRRSFATLLAGMTALLRGGSARAREPTPLALLSQPNRAAALGARCLQALPPGQSVQHLTAALGAGGETGEALRRRIARQVVKDFAQGAIVDVEGWQLSLTEARLCALAALSARQDGFCQV